MQSNLLPYAMARVQKMTLFAMDTEDALQMTHVPATMDTTARFAILRSFIASVKTLDLHLFAVVMENVLQVIVAAVQLVI